MSCDGDDGGQKVQIDRQFGDGIVECGLIEERLHNLQQWCDAGKRNAHVEYNYYRRNNK